MAGGGPGGPLRTDPAIEQWNSMRENVYKHFRFTPKATVRSLVGMVVFPGLIYYTCTSTDLQFNWGGKRKGESLAA